MEERKSQSRKTGERGTTTYCGASQNAPCTAHQTAPSEAAPPSNSSNQRPSRQTSSPRTRPTVPSCGACTGRTRRTDDGGSLRRALRRRGVAPTLRDVLRRRGRGRGRVGVGSAVISREGKRCMGVSQEDERVRQSPKGEQEEMPRRKKRKERRRRRTIKSASSYCSCAQLLSPHAS